MTLSGDKVTHIPVLKCAMNIGTADFIINVELNLPTTILNGGKASLTHHPLEHHTASYFDMDFFGGQFLFSEAIVVSMKVYC